MSENNYEVGQVVYVEWPGAMGEPIRRHTITDVSKAGRATIDNFTLLPNGKLLGYTKGYHNPRLRTDIEQVAAEYDRQLARRIMRSLAEQFVAANVNLATAKLIRATVGPMLPDNAGTEKAR